MGDVVEAVLRSKVDAGLLDSQMLVVLRLSKHNAEVIAALLEAPELSGARAQVHEAGCEVLPEWASGAVLLAPLTREQAAEAGLELRAHHVVAAQIDQGRVETILAAIRCRRRPKVSLEPLAARPSM